MAAQGKGITGKPAAPIDCRSVGSIPTDSNMKPTLLEAYKLLERGTLAFAEIESVGIRIDADYLDRAIARVTKKIDRLHQELQEDETFQEWEKLEGNGTSLSSRHQLFKVLTAQGHKLEGKTKKGNEKKDGSTLRNLNLPFVDKWLDWDFLKNKVKTTYLEGIRREVVDDILHSGYSLNTVISFRSSGSEPNFQNIPIRSPKYGKMIRQAFIPREGNALVEVDYSGIEVKISACYHKDPSMLMYIKDKSKDMHRDMAAECYMIEVKDVSKESRYAAKNQFVFPQFYGSVYFQCAPALWESIGKMKLTRADGVSLRDHLREQGIKKLGDCNPKESPKKGTFEHHIKEVEQRFWNERFPVYTQWKESWYRKYRERGYFDMKTGFRCSGLMQRNDVLSYGIQGSAFHCLLWSIIEIQREMKRRKMKAKIVGQIHDSVICDCPLGEIDEFLTLTKETMTVKLPQAWEWIIVPLEVECEVGKENWHAKVPYIELGNGKWGPKDG